jgi:hypothetical protein
MKTFRQKQAVALVEYIGKAYEYVADKDKVFVSDMAEKCLSGESFCFEEIKELERVYCEATEKQLNKVV